MSIGSVLWLIMVVACLIACRKIAKGTLARILVFCGLYLLSGVVISAVGGILATRLF